MNKRRHVCSSLKNVKSPVYARRPQIETNGNGSVGASDSSRSCFWGRVLRTHVAGDDNSRRSKRDVDYKYGNGTREKRNVDVWMEEEARLLAKKATAETTEIPALNVQSRARSIFAHESVYSSAKRRFSSRLGRERIRREGEYRTPRSLHENAVLSRKRREKNVVS